MEIVLALKKGIVIHLLIKVNLNIPNTPLF